MNKSNVVLQMQLMAYTITFLINYAGHWFPWDTFQFLVDDRGMLHRVLAYTHGVATILMGYVLIMNGYANAGQCDISVWLAVRHLVACVVAAGLGTVIPYGVDRAKARGHIEKDNQSYEQAITS